MSYSLKEELAKPERLSGGHRMCAGCGSPIAVRTVLRAVQTGGPGGRLLRDRLSRGVHVFISVYGLEGQLYPQRV